MGRLYDISNRLDNSKPEVKIDKEHTFKINTHKAVGLKIDDLYKDKEVGNFEKMDQVIKIALGDQAFDYIESLKLTIPNYTTIINVIMAAIGGTSLEEVEKEAKEQNKKK
jgi:hypothetical protein